MEMALNGGDLANVRSGVVHRRKKSQSVFRLAIIMGVLVYDYSNPFSAYGKFVHVEAAAAVGGQKMNA